MEKIKNRPHTSPKDFFLHLLNIVTLYVSAVGFGRLLFLIINKTFPDALGAYYSGGSSYDSMRWAIASMIIAFPLYIISSKALNKQYLADPDKKNLRVKQWLEYFTLFGTAIVIMVDFITIVYYFLGGEVTARFIFKAITVLYISGAIFGYYLFIIKERAKTLKQKVVWSFVIVNVVVMIASIILGFVVVGSPATQRLRNFDQVRIQNLDLIKNEAITYWQKTGVLVSSLDQLAKVAYSPVPLDPQTKLPYSYRIIENPYIFELCAEFNLDKAPEEQLYAQPIYPGSRVENDIWNTNYTAGKNCFTVTIDPEIYPPVKK